MSSRQGKCSLTTINKYLKYEGLDTIPSYSTLKGESKDDLIKLVKELTLDIIGRPGEVSLFRNLNHDGKENLNRIYQVPTTTGNKKDKDIEGISESDLISKYQSLLLLKILFIDGKDGKGSKVIQDIMWYALAIQWSLGDKPAIICPYYMRVVEY
jgi:hypothetical protein